MKPKTILTSLMALAVLTGLALAATQKPTLTAPTITCNGSTGSTITLLVSATGQYGAPAGFSIQWITLADYNANGWPADSDNPPAGSSFCKASFSGMASGYNYSLAPGANVSVTLGDVLFDTPGASSSCPDTPLQCGTAYVFRAFAHANSTYNKSAFSANVTCTTASCGGAGCTLTQGYWKNHASAWPQDVIDNGLTLGNVTYSQDQLLSIFGQAVTGNGLVSLAHQLIAAKLNIANGADSSAAAQAISDADTMIGNQVIPPVGSGSLSPSGVSSLVITLTSYNEGGIGPGSCE
jgi:hypothetical protein